MKLKKIVIFVIIFILTIVAVLYIINNKSKGSMQNDINNTDNNSNNQIIEKISEYNDPPVPHGFKKIETETASWEIENGVPKGWNDGLVIEDEIGNQFVWIPIKTGSLGASENVSRLPQSINSQNDQIKKYGGFYVSRYEAGVSAKMQNINDNISEETNDINGIPVSKKGVRPWNYIGYDNAKANSESMYSNEYIQSGLITKSQWSAIISFFSRTYDTETELEVDSTNIGNYSNSDFKFTGLYSTDNGKSYKYGKDIDKYEDTKLILSTGLTDRNKKYNIYDLAGNLVELTTSDSQGRIYITGGSYLDGGITSLSNIDSIVINPNSKIGFRVVLYIK